MPEMDGLEATRIIRSTPELKDLPIVALTASVGEKERGECFEAGMNACLSKSIDRDELFATLRKWIPSEQQIKKLSIAITK